MILIFFKKKKEKKLSVLKYEISIYFKYIQFCSVKDC